ncbi:MAG: sigma-70 family RNA polymerase sigma factor [Thermodesulfobacteriota bacterium]|nr:sigma-70 family RNA polymerase sigma factor [Thermodesulfobacteriota bacterium]
MESTQTRRTRQTRKQRSRIQTEKRSARLSKSSGMSTGKRKNSDKAVVQHSQAGAMVAYDPLQVYLKSVRQYRLLSRDEEKALAIRFQEQDDKAALYELVVSNLRLVVKIALDFQRVWMQNLMDLIQEGNMGLLQAAKKFDPYRKVKFSYYASFWIKAYILKFIMDNYRLVKLGTTQAQRKLFYKLNREKQQLISQGIVPETKLISQRLGVTKKDVDEMSQRLGMFDLSLDAPVTDESGRERMDFIPSNDETVDDQVARRQIRALLREKVDTFRRTLSSRERFIFDNRMYTESPNTLREIGDQCHISKERVRQVEMGIRKNMKSFLRQELPDIEPALEKAAAAV